MLRAAGLALLLALAVAAPASAAPTLRSLGTFTPPTWAGAPASEPTRVFVTERAGRVRVIVDGVVQSTPFLDITGITASRVASAGCCRSRSRPTTRRPGVLRLPDRHAGGLAEQHHRRDPDPRVPALGLEPERRRRRQRPAAAGDPALQRRQPQRRAGPLRPRRQAVAGDGRRRRLEQPVRARAEPDVAARQAAAAGPGDARRSSNSRRACATRGGSRSRRRGEIVIADVGQGPWRGGQRRARPQLRLAVPRGPRTTSGPTTRAAPARASRTRCSRRPTARRRHVLLDHRRRRRARSRACRRSSAATSTATTAPRRCARSRSRTRPATPRSASRCRR